MGYFVRSWLRHSVAASRDSSQPVLDAHAPRDAMIIECAFSLPRPFSRWLSLAALQAAKTIAGTRANADYVTDFVYYGVVYVGDVPGGQVAFARRGNLSASTPRDATVQPGGRGPSQPRVGGYRHPRHRRAG